ncbi:hypothetical protein J1N35_005798 [Gossypium stocksii]|uniref:Uncharacterized protein n=1 Tax=Gossypium stocksii TaxID=47602 RepID=A0A9D3WF51_9ROSI|nr:hypothetical protein J1N35_005798 [Gossypium stocksii]
MTLGVKISKMGSDLSLRAQSRRVLAMNSIWLHEEGEGKLGGNCEDNRVLGNRQWDVENKMRNQMERGQRSCSFANGIEVGSEGGLPRDERGMELFRRALEECQLIDVGFSGKWFIWERSNLPETNIQERLDRGAANAKWISMFPEIGERGKYEHLLSGIDHCVYEDNRKLTAQYTKEEIREAMFEMGPIKAP